MADSWTAAAVAVTISSGVTPGFCPQPLKERTGILIVAVAFVCGLPSAAAQAPVGNEAISLEQLKERYDDPGLLAKASGTTSSPSPL